MEALRLVSTKELEHHDWLEWRKKGIGGSDVAAICGLSRYRSPLAVYLDKLGEIPPLEDNEKMKAGRILEPVIADWFAEETGMKVMKRNAIFQHKNHPFMLANIDRWLPGLNAGLEIKNTGEYSRDDWSGTQAPTEYVLQCNHYMAVTGAERWYIAVLIGGWDMQWRIIERDESLIKNLITIEESFWNNHVIAKVAPEVNAQDTELLGKMYPTSNAAKMEVSEFHYEMVKHLIDTKEASKRAEVAHEEAKNKMKNLMGDNELALWQGEKLCSWKTNARGSRVFKILGGI